MLIFSSLMLLMKIKQMEILNQKELKIKGLDELK